MSGSIYPNLRLPELVSVQPMTGPGVLFYTQYLVKDYGPVHSCAVPWMQGCPHGYGMPMGCCCNCRRLWEEDRENWEKIRLKGPKR